MAAGEIGGVGTLILLQGPSWCAKLGVAPIKDGSGGREDNPRWRQRCPKMAATAFRDGASGRARWWHWAACSEMQLGGVQCCGGQLSPDPVQFLQVLGTALGGGVGDYGSGCFVPRWRQLGEPHVGRGGSIQEQEQLPGSSNNSQRTSISTA